METIESLRNQISSAEDLQAVVKTMKGIAAVSIRQYERAVESLRDYTEVVELGFQMAAQQRPEAQSLTEDAGDGPIAAIVFGSDQGMCGSLNRDIVEYALEHLNQDAFRSRERFFAPIGVRTLGELESADERFEAPFKLPHSVMGLTSAVQEVLVSVENWRKERDLSRVLLFYNQPRRGASYEPGHRQLLPLDDAWLRELAQRPWPTKMLPAHAGEWPAFFAALVRQYLFVALFQAFAESLASENASRLAAMQAAENNIEEKIDDLYGRYHRRRQAAITEELLDVISGFEALETDEED